MLYVQCWPVFVCQNQYLVTVAVVRYIYLYSNGVNISTSMIVCPKLLPVQWPVLEFVVFITIFEFPSPSPRSKCVGL